jgi:protocatechuate 4,5-dioxygenase beta chain
MARIVGGIACSHVPAIGAALDKGNAGNPYWKPYFDGIEPAREWLAKLKPDVAILIYNDHANAFSLKLIPTFLGVAGFRSPTRASAAAGPHGARHQSLRLTGGPSPTPT